MDERVDVHRPQRKEVNNSDIPISPYQFIHYEDGNSSDTSPCSSTTATDIPTQNEMLIEVGNCLKEASMEIDETCYVPSCQSYTTITDLPEEVLPEIFGHLDTLSMLACKQVCRTWWNQIKYLEEKPPKDFWFTNCQREIPAWVQLDLLDNIYPTHFVDKSVIDWQEIYKCWYKWKMLVQNNPSPDVQEIIPDLPGVSCMQVSGSWLLCSAYQGGGKLVGCKLTIGEIFVIYKGSGPVNSFEAVNTDSWKDMSIGGISRNLKDELNHLFDTMDHNELWLELNHRYIKLEKGQISILDGSVRKIRHSHGYEANFCYSLNSYVCNINKMSAKVPGPESIKFGITGLPGVSSPRILSSPFASKFFWMNKITLACATFYSSDATVAIEVNTFDTRTKHVTTGYIDKIPTGPIQSLQQIMHTSWQGRLCITFTSSPLLIFHYEGVRKVQRTPLKKAYISYGMFYCGNLFLGTDRGDILIYEVKNPSDVLSVVVHETEPSYSIKVCNQKIVKIIVAEQHHTNLKNPVICCATCESVYSISFPRF